MKKVLQAVAAAVTAIVAVGAGAAAFGHSDVLPVIVSGAFGSPFALQGTALKTVPLLLTGLAVVVAFRAGVWNIGGEGQFLIGALAAYVAAPMGSLVSILAAMAGGAAWASIASAMRIWRGAPEVLTTILLNFVAIHVLGFAVNAPLQEAKRMYPQTELIADSTRLPMLGASRLHAGVLIALLAAIGVWWLLYRTVHGLRLRATGHNASAARSAGIVVETQIVRAMLISGALAGLAGGVELLGVTHRLFERFASGYGYSGIAAALLAQLHPLGTIASATFFGALATGAGELQRSANVSASVAVLAQAIAILVVIALDRAPSNQRSRGAGRRWWQRASRARVDSEASR